MDTHGNPADHERPELAWACGTCGMGIGDPCVRGSNDLARIRPLRDAEGHPRSHKSRRDKHLRWARRQPTSEPVETLEPEPAEIAEVPEPEPVTPPSPSGRAVWEGVAMSGLGAARLRIAVTDLGDDERAELRIEVECDPGSDAGIHTREPGHQEAGLGLLLRAGGRSAVCQVSELLRMLASKVDVALLLASVPGSDLGEPPPPADLDLDAFPAVLEGEVLDPEPNPESSLDLLRATFAQIYDRNDR